MRRGRFAVLSFASLLAALLAASLVPWPLSAVVTSSAEPAGLGLAEARVAPPAGDGGAVVAVDAITTSHGTLCAPSASRVLAMRPAPSRRDCAQVGPHAGRAPPIA